MLLELTKPKLKLKVVYRKVSDYDLKEIVLFLILLTSSDFSIWKRVISFMYIVEYLENKCVEGSFKALCCKLGSEVRPNDYKKQGDAEPKRQVKETESEPSVLEDLGYLGICRLIKLRELDLSSNALTRLFY
ncbi:uncharacterized protein LOC9325941 [Arabidopsis lyrata subsp. lyrata]|uniref:uncharacterized protein LOC9325941 n=1 Tax=Arabidopsis lyrata subsp. lyrata TaxID=81972 RepID=UPI000A29C00D|nr:uncharacterized protein LOC9325941 [Arabidopsis lyrata subsp. lyrata]|eukprot:XP_020870982.1 uncharacterized protein LOC9325941 [Arabidopsis lyrata subsp. lyrata]